MNPLVSGTGQRAVGGHHIEALEAGHSREQVPVGVWDNPSGSNARLLTVTIACRNGRGLASAISRSRRPCSSRPCSAQRRSNSVKAAARNRVCRARRRAPRSISAPGSSRDKASRSKEDTSFSVATQRVVEVEHPGDERGAQAERRLVARPACRSTGHTENDLTFDS